MQTPPTTSAPFDVAYFFEQIGDDDVARHLLGLFLETADGAIAALAHPQEPIMSDGYAALWQRQVHLLRGSALNIGANRLAAFTEHAELDFAGMGIQARQFSLQELQTHYRELRDYILTLLPLN